MLLAVGQRPGKGPDEKDELLSPLPRITLFHLHLSLWNCNTERRLHLRTESLSPDSLLHRPSVDP